MENQQQQIEENINYSTIIVSVHTKGEKATLIDITNNNDIKILEDFNIYGTSNVANSSVTVDGSVMIFGGYDPDSGVTGLNTIWKFSIRNKSVSQTPTITEFQGAGYISACYNEKDNAIYLVGGYNYDSDMYLTRIDRYFPLTRKFERFHQCSLIAGNIVVHSFFYKGKMYIVPRNKNEIYSFDPITKETNTEYTLLSNDGKLKFGNARTACDDGNGNIYIHSRDKTFIRYNIDNHNIDILDHIDRNFELTCLKSLFCRENQQQEQQQQKEREFIYLVGGNSVGNYFYSVADNKWTRFYLDDPHKRLSCHSDLIRDVIIENNQSDNYRGPYLYNLKKKKQ